MGHAATAEVRRTASYQHPERVVPPLARLAEAGKPLPGPVQQLRRIRAGAEPGNQKEARRLVRAE